MAICGVLIVVGVAMAVCGGLEVVVAVCRGPKVVVAVCGRPAVVVVVVVVRSLFPLPSPLPSLIRHRVNRL